MNQCIRNRICNFILEERFWKVLNIIYVFHVILFPLDAKQFKTISYQLPMDIPEVESAKEELTDYQLDKRNISIVCCDSRIACGKVISL